MYTCLTYMQVSKIIQKNEKSLMVAFVSCFWKYASSKKKIIINLTCMIWNSLSFNKRYHDI